MTGGSKTLAWIGIVLAVAYLTIGGGGGWIGIYDVRWRVASLALTAIALALWFAVMWRRPFWRPRSVLWPSFAAALGAFAISTVASWDARLSLEYAAYAVILTALYLMLVRLLADPFFRQRLGALAVVLCVTTGAMYLAVVVGAWLSWWSALGRVATPPLRPDFAGLVYGNPSAVATMMVLLCTASLAFLGFDKGRRRVLVTILIALTATVVLLTGSRGAWLGVGLAVGAAVLLGISLPTWRSTVRRLAARRTVRLVAVVGVLGVIVVGAALLPALLGRLAQNSISSRITFYEAALRMFASAPLLGSGPGTWVARRAAFTDTSGVDLYIPHAHDIYLQTLAEFGLLGAVVGAIVVASLLWLVLGGIRGADPVRRRYGWAALFALVYLAGHQIVDFYANMPSVLFALALTVGVLDATGPSLPSWGVVRGKLKALGRQGTRPPVANEPGTATAITAGRGLFRDARWLPLPAMPIVVVAALVFSGWSESVAVTQWQSVTAADTGHWADALSLARQAAASDPGMPPYQFTLGIAAAATGHLSQARDAFARVATTDGFPEAWLDLAAVELRVGAPNDARLDLDRAMRLGPQQLVVNVAAASLYVDLGDLNAAAQAIARAEEMVPWLAGDPYWSSTPQLRAAADRGTVLAITASGPTLGYQIALAAGRSDEAVRQAASLAPGDAAHAALVIRAWSGDRAALAALAAQVVAHPLTADSALAALVAEHLGDVSTEERMSAIGTTGGVSTEGEVAIGMSCGDCAQMPGSGAPFYGIYTYRRPIPADMLVLDLPRLAFR